MRPETLKLVHERAGNTLEALGIGKDFLNRTSTAQQLKEQMGVNEIKNLLQNKRNGL
jgi:hypothetical protein